MYARDLLIFSLVAKVTPQPTDGHDAMKRSEEMPGLMTAHAIQWLCPDCWKYGTHEPRHLWAPLFRSLDITPTSGIFVDGGAACDMVDGDWALSANFSVLAFETRSNCIKHLHGTYSRELARASTSGWPSPAALRLLPNEGKDDMEETAAPTSEECVPGDKAEAMSPSKAPTRVDT